MNSRYLSQWSIQKVTATWLSMIQFWWVQKANVWYLLEESRRCMSMRANVSLQSTSSKGSSALAASWDFNLGRIALQHQQQDTTNRVIQGLNTSERVCFCSFKPFSILVHFQQKTCLVDTVGASCDESKEWRRDRECHRRECIGLCT